MIGFNLQLVQLVGGFWVFFLSHTVPRFRLWFYFHLWIWVVHWGLLLRLPWRTWVCPSEGQVQRWLQLLGSQGFWQHQVLRGVGGQGSRKYSALEGYGSQCWPICSSILARRTPLPDREAYKVAKGQTLPKQPCMHRCKIFFSCGSSAPVRAERERGTAAWLARTLEAPSLQQHGLPPPQELWSYQSLFSSLM